MNKNFELSVEITKKIFQEFNINCIISKGGHLISGYASSNTWNRKARRSKKLKMDESFLSSEKTQDSEQNQALLETSKDPFEEIEKKSCIFGFNGIISSLGKNKTRFFFQWSIGDKEEEENQSRVYFEQFFSFFEKNLLIMSE